MDELRDVSVLQTVAFASLGELLLLCHAPAAPSDEDWNAWVERCNRREHSAIMISTHGGSPNSAQRARVASAAINQGRPPVALLTDSAVLRGLMTAFVWLLGPEQRIKAFSPSGVADAVQWLGVSVQTASASAAIAHLHEVLET